MPIYQSSRGSAKKTSIGLSNLAWLVILVSGMISFGILLSIAMVPSIYDSSNGPGTNSILTKHDSRSIKTKILEWLPKQHNHLLDHMPDNSVNVKPDFSHTFWTPIDLDVTDPGVDPMVVLCQLNFKEYSENPHMYSMFRDFVGISNCIGRNRKRERLSVLVDEIKSEAGGNNLNNRAINPTGFVFHESRVGSTLVANLLGSNPWAMVFSESAPAANALLHCSLCSREENVKLFRDIVTVMGRSPYHKEMYFKFQSITTTKIEIALEAFPDTPWAFVYRQPVQTMMSHLDPKKASGGAPCLRSMRSPPEEVQNTISRAGAKSQKEAWCAAHLDMLCNSALRAYSKFNTTISTDGIILPRAVLINYEALPGIIPRVVLPIFGVEPSKMWLEKMSTESKHYSKGKSTSRIFQGDSADKDERATADIQKFANAILEPTYKKMSELSERGILEFSPGLFEAISTLPNHLKNWKDINGIPSELDSFSVDLLEKVRTKRRMSVVDTTTLDPENSHYGDKGYQHSKFRPSEEHAFLPWAPFSNVHNSKPMEKIYCPPIPMDDYPKAYPILDLLNNWGTDDTVIPNFHFDSLCHFDFQNQTELNAAYAYRRSEVPFVVYNIPEVDAVVKKWSNLDYLVSKLGTKTKYRTETSKTNHFMYWRGGGGFLRNPDGSKWNPPTGTASVTFEEWLEVSVKGQNKSLDDRLHQYFRVSSDANNEWLFDELPFFQPKESLMMVNPREQRGIHCRFGMRSVIAEAHFDGSRNAIAMLGGLRRWILTHPNQCDQMHMYPRGHPSARHSQVDWSSPNISKFPNFPNVHSNEVILQPGDFLYVPTYWIHYIVSLNVNYQCNTRSGISHEFDRDIRKCGF